MNSSYFWFSKQISFYKIQVPEEPSDDEEEEEDQDGSNHGEAGGEDGDEKHKSRPGTIDFPNPTQKLIPTRFF